MESLEEAFESDHALVFGIGGSADVVGAIPTARLLELHGVEVTLGGITWEPTPRDPTIGPRSFDEIDGLQPLSETVALATGETKTHDGVEFTETKVAAHLEESIALIDITRGLDGMVEGLNRACETAGWDLVVGTDSGGDALALGDEPGLRSPVADGLGLATLDTIETDAVLGVFGYGSDGELSIEELEAGIVRAAKRDGLLGAWGLTRRVREELEGLLDVVSTEASRLPVEAARGEVGERTIRGGEVRLELTPASMVTFYFDPATVVDTSEIVDHVFESRGLEDLQARLSAAGMVTEFDREARRL